MAFDETGSFTVSDAPPPKRGGFDESSTFTVSAAPPQKKKGGFPDFPLSPALKSAREQAIFNEALENTRRNMTSPGARAAQLHEGMTLGGRLMATGAGAAEGGAIGGLPGAFGGGLAGWFGSGALMSRPLKEQLAQEQEKYPVQTSTLETLMTAPPLIELGGAVPGMAISSAKAVARGAGKLAGRAKAAVNPSRLFDALGAPTDRAAVGEAIRAKLKPQLEDAHSEREKQFQVIKDRYLKAGEEQAGDILQHARATLNQDYSRLAATGEADEDLRKAYTSVLSALKPVPTTLAKGEKQMSEAGFARLERLRRMLNHRSQTQMKAGEGGKAISAADAKTLADHVTNAIDTYLGPISRGFRSGYRDLSRLINEFNETALGQKVTRTEGDRLPTIEKVPPDKLGPAFFQSRAGVESLNRLAGGDTAWLQRVARQHAINEIQRIPKDADSLQKWVDSNTVAPNTWLNAPELRGLKTELEQTVRQLRAAHTTRLVGAGLGAAGIAGAAGAYGKSVLSKIAGTL